uniref:Apple domain-containing protein n=1 Tax=Ditylenchus dipsaci TaxID=166011 RepID=A0A915D944_9BILA
MELFFLRSIRFSDRTLNFCRELCRKYGVSELFFDSLLLLVVLVSSANAAKNAKKQKEGVMAESNNAFCENLMSAFYVSDNVNVMSNASAVAKNITEQSCLDLCSSNKDPNGRLVFCASVVYDRDQSQCLMYRKSSEPDGELLRKPEDGKRYFEKFCLAEDVPRDCANKQFVRVDDYILKGYAQATAVFPSMAECVAHCIRKKEFECRSAMYFYEEGECITNLESAITRPDDFMKPDDDDKVVFFHNGCIQPGLRAEVAASEDEEDNKDDSSSGETPENEPEAPVQPSTTTAESPSTTQLTTQKVVYTTTMPQEIVTESPTTTTVSEPSTTTSTELPSPPRQLHQTLPLLYLR